MPDPHRTSGVDDRPTAAHAFWTSLRDGRRVIDQQLGLELDGVDASVDEPAEQEEAEAAAPEISPRRFS
jgi:hypothetical protein